MYATLKFKKYILATEKNERRKDRETERMNRRPERRQHRRYEKRKAIYRANSL